MTLWLLGALGWLRKAATALFDLARRYPLAAALIVALAACGWLWHSKGKALAERDAARAEVSAMIEAGKQATALALKERAANQAAFAKLKKEADNGHSTALADADRRTADFIRLRANRGSCAAKADPASEGPSAGVPESAPAETVLVEASDVMACSAASIYADEAHKWARGLIEAGVGG